ncbi:alpha/beta fold hydrolase [Saccharopolyspora rectivirgula]|uniref:alpha/beta fold hydrolase n=1 Tax=Saccharopolyspora rectivirgula TaxID=28042 RepID=UPI0024098F91|nr:alpha/beta hydrolase [Saccharopolyspora rectivirgula]
MTSEQQTGCSMMARKKRGVVFKAAVVLGVVVALVGVAAAGYVIRNLNYARWDAAKMARAGYEEHQVQVNGSVVNYAEGPDNGPPLLLIHGQGVDWQNWNRVLPELAENFHVFAVDCYGHGKSAHVPEKYTARAIAADLERFLADVVGEPAFVAGHSSGGLIASVMAAEKPDLVRGVVLEDPPFFSSVLPRAQKTFNYVDLSTTAHEFLLSGETDFIDYYLRNSRMWSLFQGAEERVRSSALNTYRKNPDQPLRIFYLPPSLNEMFRSMGNYDPRFGDTFYTNRFHEGFDHAETLERISVPAVLIHTNWSYSEDGVLLAAMSGEDAQRARSLIKDVSFHKVDSGHGFHFEKPDEFIDIVTQFLDRVQR